MVDIVGVNAIYAKATDATRPRLESEKNGTKIPKARREVVTVTARFFFNTARYTGPHPTSPFPRFTNAVTASQEAVSSNMTDRRQLARATKPIPCYAVNHLPPKEGGDELYEALSKAVADGKAKLIEELEIPPRDARTWVVKAGQLWRIICHRGPQVADMNCWCLENPDEHFYSSKTRQIHATHLTTGDRLWSNMGYVRPLATIVCDTISYGWDDDGAGVHDVIGSRCDPYTHKLMTGQEQHTCCHSNLTRACGSVEPAGTMDERHVHDVLNVFMCTGFTRDTHQYFTKPVREKVARSQFLCCRGASA